MLLKWTLYAFINSYFKSWFIKLLAMQPYDCRENNQVTSLLKKLYRFQNFASLIISSRIAQHVAFITNVSSLKTHLFALRPNRLCPFTDSLDLEESL